MAAYQYIYVMKGMSKIYPGGKEILKDVWLSFLPGAKIGVVGVNGAGKSTLLRIMAGQETEFLGEAWAADGVSVGYLAQEPVLDEDEIEVTDVEEGEFGDLDQEIEVEEEEEARPARVEYVPTPLKPAPWGAPASPRTADG